MNRSVVFALGAFLFGVSASSAATKRWFVDQNLVFERGSALSQAYLQKHDPDFSGKLEGLLPWIVRIEAKHSYHKGDEEQGIPVSRLSPMLVVTSVEDAKAMSLKPLAGFPPVGGMSGGPVLNLKGEVIGVQISVSTTREDATGKVVGYTVNAVPLGEVGGG